MHESKNLRWWIAGGVALALVFAYVVPRHLTHPFLPAASRPSSDATVPAQLLALDQNPGVAGQTPTPAPTEIAAYVCGRVRRPGVYKFAHGLRVADAIARAGGALPDADLDQLNLAEPLSDAIKIAVPKKGQSTALGAYADASSTTSDQRSYEHFGRHSGRSSHKLQPGQTLDINTASESELTALPGVGPGLARRIVEYRTANGPFQSVDDLQNVSGIGPSKFDRLVPFVRL